MAYPSDPIVLDFPDDYNAHVNHGLFWPVGVNLGPFLAETWIMPRAGAEYWVSEGFGGAHALLDGFGGGLNISGNTSSDGGSVTLSYVGEYLFKAGEWAYRAVGWDGTYIWNYVNGVPVGCTAFAGPRRAQQGFLFIGGSDHSNFHGRIAQVRIFEDLFPLQSGAAAYRPDRPFGAWAVNSNTYTPAAFLASYMTPCQGTIPDYGVGYRGLRHPGGMYAGGKNTGLGTGVQNLTYPLASYVVDTTAPFYSDSLVLPDETIPSPTTPPGGVKIFDSWARRNQTLAFQAAPTLGNTEGGSLGAKTWQQGSLVNPAAVATTGSFLLLQQRAVPCTNYAVAWVSNDSADMDVRVKRQLPVGADFKRYAGVAFRVSDAGNCWTLVCNYGGGEIWQLKKWAAGAETNVGSYAVANDGTTMRVTTAGNVITIYKSNGGSWTQVAQVTDSYLNTATGAGLAMYGAQNATWRHGEFSVY